MINHLTQNPTEIISIHEKGYTTDNAKGKWLWNAMLDWTKRDYLIFLGTGSFSWVHGHAYTIIGAYDLTINGTKQQWIRVRNPWGKTDWTAETSQDPTAYKKNHPEVIKLIGKEMPGTFDFTFDDLLHQVENVSVDLGQYSKNGTAVAPQYTKVLEVPHADSATDNKTFKVAIKTWKNLNLEDFWLAIDTIQGGNRIGTLADKNLQGISGWFYYSLYSNTNSYSS